MKLKDATALVGFVTVGFLASLIVNLAIGTCVALVLVLCFDLGFWVALIIGYIIARTVVGILEDLDVIGDSKRRKDRKRNVVKHEMDQKGGSRL